MKHCEKMRPSVSKSPFPRLIESWNFTPLPQNNSLTLYHTILTFNDSKKPFENIVA